MPGDANLWSRTLGQGTGKGASDLYAAAVRALLENAFVVGSDLHQLPEVPEGDIIHARTLSCV